MNFLYKRSVLSRPRIFQEGGSNIFLGDAKPYEVAVPLAGPSSNPAVSNKPVEINTTGLADTFNKQKDLAYKWAELQYKYKELESKEGRDYLDAMMDVYKNVGNTSELIKGYGGTGSLGVYNEQSSAELSKISDLHSKAALELAARNPRGFANAVAEMAQLSTKNTDLRFKTGFLDKLLDGASKGEMGYLTKRFMDSYFNHIQDPNAVPFEEVTKQGTYALGMKIKAKDISDLLEGYKKKYTDLKPVKTDVGVELLPSGLVKVESKYILPSRETMRAEMKRDLLMDERGKSYLYEQGINPDNPNSKELDSFIDGLIEPTYQSLVEAYQGSIFDISGSAQKDVDVVNGKLVSVEKDGADGAGGGKKDKEAEWEYKNRVFEAEIRDKYGEEFTDDPTVVSIIATGGKREDILNEIEEYAKKLGKIAAGGAAGAEQKKVRFEREDRKGVIQGPPTENGLMENAGINQELTRAFTGKDGKRYIATVQPDVIEYAKQSGFPQVLETKEDDDIRDYMNKEDADKWDIPVFWMGLANEYLFEVKETAGPTGGASLQPGDEGFIKIDDTNALGVSYPRAKDFNQPVSKGLARRALPVLQDYTLRVTDTSDSSIHKAASQALYKTGFDVNFESEAGNPPGKLPSFQSREKIASVIKAFRAQGLQARYEVKTKANKDALLMQSRGNGWGITEDMVDVVPYITGNHFSVWCEECKRFGGGSGAATEGQTGSAETAPASLEDETGSAKALSDEGANFLLNALKNKEKVVVPGAGQ